MLCFSTCYANKLAKHLKICNARQTALPPYILKGVNCGQIEPELNSTQITARLLSNVPTEKIVQIIEKINKVYKGNIYVC